MKNVLIPMTDFVLQQIAWNIENKKVEKDHSFSDLVALEIIEEYANFLKQPLQLGFFVPTDEEGNVLEPHSEPDREEYWDRDNDVFNGELFQYRVSQWKAYIKAKERVLFEGFELVFNQNKLCVLGREKYKVIIENNPMFPHLIEDHCGHELPLTPTALKQIYG